MRGIAFGYSGDAERARQQFEGLLKDARGAPTGWEAALVARVQDLRLRLHDSSEFKAQIERDIASGREQLKLPVSPTGSGVI